MSNKILLFLSFSSTFENQKMSVECSTSVFAAHWILHSRKYNCAIYLHLWEYRIQRDCKSKSVTVSKMWVVLRGHRSVSKWTVLLGYLHDRKSLVCSNVPNFTVIGALFYRDPIWPIFFCLTLGCVWSMLWSYICPSACQSCPSVHQNC